jgi:Flp pilus assembly pilin Flp
MRSSGGAFGVCPSFLVSRLIPKGGNWMIGLNSMIAGLALYVPDGARKRLRPLAGERGQAFVEYVLLLTVVAIAVALVTAWTGFVSTITAALTKIGNTITNP